MTDIYVTLRELSTNEQGLKGFKFGRWTAPFGAEKSVYQRLPIAIISDADRIYMRDAQATELLPCTAVRGGYSVDIPMLGNHWPKAGNRREPSVDFVKLVWANMEIGGAPACALRTSAALRSNSVTRVALGGGAAQFVAAAVCNLLLFDGHCVYDLARLPEQTPEFYFACWRMLEQLAATDEPEVAERVALVINKWVNMTHARTSLEAMFGRQLSGKIADILKA